jgi:septal ring factor EnvC (AmiA/AmiB activator)
MEAIMNRGSKQDQEKVSTYLENLPEEATRRGEDNEHLVLRTLGRHKQNIVPLIFDRKERILVKEHLLAELTVGFEHRRQALTMVLETPLHSVREACNHVLVTGKTHLRQQRLEYFGKVYRQVAEQMDTLSTDFLTGIDQRFQNLEKYKTQCIRDREQKRLEKSVDDFLDTLDQLLEEFRHIVSENIDHRQAN